MNTKTTYGIAFLVGVGCTTILLMVAHRRPASPAPPPIAKVEVKKPANDARPAEEIITTVEIPAVPEPVKRIELTNAPPATPTVRTPQPSIGAELQALDPVAKEQLGRYTLNFVGADPVADQVWSSLINDPSLSEKVREDLIEDLNENGFSDGNGRVPTVDDLPLIESRIMLLMQHAPYAMDEVNAASFAEAYKDLANMWLELTRR